MKCIEVVSFRSLRSLGIVYRRESSGVCRGKNEARGEKYGNDVTLLQNRKKEERTLRQKGSRRWQEILATSMDAAKTSGNNGGSSGPSFIDASPSPISLLANAGTGSLRLGR